jgi:hypothetical protein
LAAPAAHAASGSVWAHWWQWISNALAGESGSNMAGESGSNLAGESGSN